MFCNHQNTLNRVIVTLGQHRRDSIAQTTNRSPRDKLREVPTQK